VTSTHDFDRVAACVRASALFRAAEAIATACERAADASAVAARVRRARGRFAALPGAERVRTIAMFTGTAAVGHLALLTIVAAHIAPATPKALWIGVAVASAIAALFARPLAASWETSAVRRAVDRIVRTFDGYAGGVRL
jgi:hypothetical protein